VRWQDSATLQHVSSRASASSKTSCLMRRNRILSTVVQGQLNSRSYFCWRGRCDAQPNVIAEAQHSRPGQDSQPIYVLQASDQTQSPASPALAQRAAKGGRSEAATGEDADGGDADSGAVPATARQAAAKNKLSKQVVDLSASKTQPSTCTKSDTALVETSRLVCIEALRVPEPCLNVGSWVPVLDCKVRLDAGHHWQCIQVSRWKWDLLLKPGCFVLARRRR